MPKAKSKTWHTYATWVARGLMVLLGAGFIGMAVRAGTYMEKVDRLETLYDISKQIAELKTEVAVLQERTKGSNSSLPTAPPTVRPTAGKQR